MNKTRRSILSVLLAIALLLPMAPAVHADDEVTLSANTADIFYPSVNYRTVIVSANNIPAGFDGTIVWSVNDPTILALPGNVGTAARSVTLTAGKAGTAAVTVTLTPTGGAAVVKTLEVTVKPNGIQNFALTMNPASIAVGAASTAVVSSATALSGELASVAFSSNDPSVASASGTNSTVTGVKKGIATITATASVNGVSIQTASANLVVTAKPGSVSDSTTVGATLTLEGIAAQIAEQYRASIGTSPTAILFTALGGSDSVGSLTAANGKPATTAETYPFSDLSKITYSSNSAGTYTFSYMIGSDFAGMGVITVSAPTTHIRIPVSSSGDYRFDRAGSDTNGKTGVELINDAIGKTGNYSLKFGAIQSGSDVGTLYTSSAANHSDLVTNGTVVSSDAVGALYFIPNRAGTYSIAYTAYANTEGTGAPMCTGNLILPVDSSSLNVTVNLDSITPYVFSASPRNGAESAASLLISTINGAVGAAIWSGIRFDGAALATDTVGTLHEMNGYRTIMATDFIAAADISKLYFVPERVGAYEIGYGVYNSKTSSTPLATGTLTINVSNVPTGNADFSYTTTAGGTVTLRESDFISYYQSVRGSRYYLSSVVFDDYSGSNTFYHDGVKFVPLNSTDFYSSTYTGTLPANARYLDRLTFVAPQTSGFTAVRFTCSGGTAPNATNIKTSGVLYIYYTDASVSPITYSVSDSSSVALREADFIAVYKSAIRNSPVNPVFEIRLLSVPNNGVLYRYYSKTGRTVLNSANISTYTFSVNGADSTSVSKLTYVPGRSSTSERVTYIAYDMNGTMLYSGEICFQYNIESVAVSYCGDGLSFPVSRFYSATDADPVIYVTFEKPSSGRIYAYTSTRYIEVPAGTRFYTNSSADGLYPISSALYAPRAMQGGAGAATITCVAHRRSGLTYEETITVTIISRDASSVFTDVDSSLSWAVNSVDFSRRLGIVGGTSTNPPLFSPRDTMRRCDLILILYRLAGSPSVTGTMPYTDLPAASTSSYAAEINNSALWAYNTGVVQNVINGTLYSTATALTRQDFAQLLYNYAKSQGISTANNGSISAYTDASKVSPYAQDGMIWAVANGYITSTSATSLTLSPQRVATRAEIVTLLHRYLTF